MIPILVESFRKPPLISFKCGKNIGNFVGHKYFSNKSSGQAGTFKCARARCETCPFFRDVEKISGPTRFMIISPVP